MTDSNQPFHAGELEAQRRAGAGDVASWASGFIRDYLPEQHRKFHTSLPFLVVAAADPQGRPWVTLLEGPEGFVRSPDAKTLEIATQLNGGDPLAQSFADGAEIGVLGIELATRRRNRLSGRLRPKAGGLTLDVRQTFGNCPQYISEREWRHAAPAQDIDAQWSDELTLSQTARIRKADTFFIGTGYEAGDQRPSSGFDASHRGGPAGFVEVVDDRHLRIPDYPGNNFFNTIGNLLKDPRVGLLFIDFDTGGLLHITGRAEIEWEAGNADAQRMIHVTIDRIVDRPGASSLRWTAENSSLRPLAITDKIEETADITSFYLAATDGAPLDGFEAGQHLPIELQVPGQAGSTKRTYSLSGAPGDKHYRLSIKREPKGIASRFMHDVLQPGNVINARRPSGDFVIPCSQCPLILVSAGVGITPMLSMLHAVTTEKHNRSVWFVHVAKNEKTHAHQDEVDRLLRSQRNCNLLTFYSQSENGDIENQSFVRKGRVSAQALLDLDAGPDAHYMLCGPANFLSDIRTGLETSNVPSAQIHFETFGPAG